MSNNTHIYWIFIFVIIAAAVGEDHHEINKNACLKPSCIDAASEIQQNIDPSIQPCDDFYNFACGGLLQNVDMPANKKGFDVFNNISDIVDEQTKIMIEESEEERGTRAVKLVKRLYDTCTNTGAIERDGLKPIHHFVNEFGGWPLLRPEGWTKTTEEPDWIDLTFKLRKFGFGDYLLSLYVQEDPRDESQHILTLGYPHLIVHKEWNAEATEAYRQLLTDVAVALGADSNKVTKDFEESVNFELQLANILGQEQERGMSIRELDFNYPGIPWLQLINTIVGDEDNGVTYDDSIVVKSPQFVLNLIQILKYASKQTVANYLLSRAVTSLLPYSTSGLRNEDLEFRKKLHSPTEYDPRWKECLHVVSGRLHVATAAMYAQKYFTDVKFQNANEIAKNIKKEFVEVLSQLKWMDEPTRQYALSKVKDMTQSIGFAPELLDNRKIDEYYSLLEPTSHSYVELIKQIDLFNIDNHYKKLRKLDKKDTWADQSHTNNIAAFYNARENALQFPAGLLQEPFFNSNRPQYLNYGALGSLIGHEIVHAFDNQGKHYAEDGGLENWWSSRTESGYGFVTRCITDYYSAQGVPEIGLNVNHLNIQDEIIADLAGVNQAYLAYKKWSEEHSAEQLLPGLNYTQNQLFWISSASIWCSKYKNDNGEEYSPGSFRVYEAFRNSEHFSKDFDCPAGSSMNPKQKCGIW